LRTKVEEQIEKRKRDRKNKTAGSPKSAAAGGTANATQGGQGKKAPVRSAPKTESEEQLLQVIDDLRNDLKLRDAEYEDQQKHLEKIKA